MPRATKNLTSIAKQLRAAGGKQMRVVGNIHMTTPGYHIIAALEAKTLPKLK
jgi:hypothetical protein